MIAMQLDDKIVDSLAGKSLTDVTKTVRWDRALKEFHLVNLVLSFGNSSLVISLDESAQVPCMQVEVRNGG